MQDHLIFFGKSQSFTFHAFSREGYVPDFQLIIPDFDLLESKWFNIDDPDNKEILAKYKFKSRNSTFSLLKLYSFGQAVASTRIEGSIYGIAILSSEDILLSTKNIKLLYSLKNYFSDMALGNLKFKKDDFKVEAEAIWKAFAGQVGFDTIERSPTLQLFNSNLATAFHVTNIESVPKEEEWGGCASDKMYFSEDLKYLKRTLKKWPKNVSLCTHDQRGNYSKFAEQTDQPSPSFTADSSAIQISELRGVQNKMRSEISALRRRFGRLRFISLFLGCALVTSLAFLYFESHGTQNLYYQTPTVTGQGSQNHSHAPFHRYILDSLLIDSTKLRKASIFLAKVDRYKLTKDQKSKKEQLKSIFVVGKALSLDSSQLQQRLK